MPNIAGHSSFEIERGTVFCTGRIWSPLGVRGSSSKLPPPRQSIEWRCKCETILVGANSDCQSDRELWQWTWKVPLGMYISVKPKKLRARPPCKLHSIQHCPGQDCWLFEISYNFFLGLNGITVPIVPWPNWQTNMLCVQSIPLVMEYQLSLISSCWR